MGDSGLCVLVRAARQAQLGITRARTFQGRGLAGETMSAVLDYAFINLDLHRVVATLDVEDTRSAALMERVGLRREGRFVKNAWFQGHWANEYLYAVLQSEWLPRRGLPAGRSAWQRSETRHPSGFLLNLSARRRSDAGA